MIPLSSDTESKPTQAMRSVMAKAKVGDEQKGQDPTVNKLLEKVCELLGKEAALFLPGGTMCNFIAVKVHTRPADVIFADHMAHIIRAESAGVSFSSGVMVEPVESSRGIFSSGELDHAITKATTVPNPYSPIPSLVCLEQSHNFGMGAVWSLDEMKEVSTMAKQRGMAVHIDGARLMNAVVASGTAAHDFAALADSIWIDFTKGLGAPMGAVLAGSMDFIKEARRHKHIFGGAMRQAGIVAAGCLYSLEHHIDRLHEDHVNAQLLAKELDQIDDVVVANPYPETNMVFFKSRNESIDNSTLVKRLAENGVSVGQIGNNIRAVTHLDVSEGDIRNTIQVIQQAISA